MAHRGGHKGGYPGYPGPPAYPGPPGHHPGHHPGRGGGRGGGHGGGQGGQMCFYIRSELNGKVLDVRGANARPGTEVIMYQKNSPPSNNQLWYLDGKGRIRSKLNDFALDGTSGKFTLNPMNQQNSQQHWTFEGKKIVNCVNRGTVADIEGCSSNNSAHVIPYRYHSAANQHWAMDYV